jgi:WD40 repeat protein
MPSIVDCRACGQKMTVPDDWAGKGLACPRCHASIDEPRTPAKEIPLDNVEVVDEEEGIYRINPEDALLPGRLAGQAEVSGTLGVMSLGRDAEPARCVALHPQNKLALAGCGETIHVVSLSERKRVLRFEKQEANVTCLATAPDGQHVLSGDRKGGLVLWELLSGQVVRWLAGHHEAVRSVAFSPTGRYAASGGDDGATRLWELDTGKELKLFEARTDRPINCVAFSLDGRRILGAGPKVRVWTVKSGEPVARCRSEGEVDSAAFSLDGKEIAACVPTSYTETGLRVHRWLAASGKELPCFESPFHNRVAVSLAAVAPGTLRIVSTGRRSGLRDDNVSGKAVKAAGLALSALRLATGGSPVRAYRNMAEFASPDHFGDRNDPCCIQFWSLNPGLAETHNAGNDPAVALAVSADGTRAVTATRDNLIQLWGVPP